MSLLPGFDPVELMERRTGNKLADTFVVPPFSVLNARDGAWQDRKRAWVECGLKGELGRSGGCGGSKMPAADYSTQQRGNGRGEVVESGDDGDLERYSDDPRDLSTMEYHTFMANYKRIIFKASQRLKPDRFACFVVGDFRDAKGNYRNFIGDTVTAFTCVGLSLYNEAILVTAVGSLPIRVTKQFTASRKLGKTHQNVLLFVKGRWKVAAKACEAAVND